MRRRVLKSHRVVLRHLAPAVLALLVGSAGALAQSGTPAPQDQQGKAGNPECVWLGRRVVRLMWLDDLDTAFRHLDLYDRFGCPGGHVQASFRCLTRFGAQIDDKVPRSLDSRIHACWINPGAQPQAAAAAAPAASGGSTPAAAPASPPAAAPAAPAK